MVFRAWTEILIDISSTCYAGSSILTSAVFSSNHMAKDILGNPILYSV